MKALLRKSEFVEVDVTPREIGSMIIQYVNSILNVGDDAGCDWMTTESGAILVGGDSNWCVSNNPLYAHLIDTANILMHGKILRV
jgi:hypothetical protein